MAITKKDALTKLKNMFRNPNLATSKLKAVREMYNSIKNLQIDDNSKIPDNLDFKMSKL